MKDWQPTPMLGAIPVRGRLFCYLGSSVVLAHCSGLRFSNSKSIPYAIRRSMA